MAKNNNETDTNGINLISIGTHIEGNINSQSDIRIDGSLKGNIKTSGKLVIGESGSVNGEVSCKNGDISGKLEGKIETSELLQLKSTAKVYGDMQIKKLSVEPGSVFTGQCSMDSRSFENAGAQESEKRTEREEKKARAI
ncbi:MAG: bactofilin family protein [Bacteroidota bacterium]